MTRTIFAALGVVFALILVFCASFLGRLAYDMHATAPTYEKLAVDITRELASAWSVDKIKTRYAAAVAGRLNVSAARRPFEALKPLGALRYVEDVTLETRWTRASFSELSSPAAAAGLLSELLSKTVHVSFFAKFANGRARVTVKLRSEGGQMKLWHLQIDSRDPLPNAPRRNRQAISRA